MSAVSHRTHRPPRLLRSARLRRVLRLAFVAFHLHAVCVLALPSPGAGMRRAAWKDPTVQHEFRTWARTLSSFGIDVEPPELEAFAWRAALAWVDLRRNLTTLARPYAEVVGARQPWRMFVAPHRYPSVLHLEVDEGTGFRPLYVARSRAYAWRGRLLDHDRMRAAIFRYAWPSYETNYHRFVRYLARKAARDVAEARRFRARYFKYRTLSPDEVLRGERLRGRFVRTYVVDLADLDRRPEGAP
ncbi:MAG: hypothetical protein D6705_03040 [Deltaproteobacteria bacterium]|nr:MAG: hypothetical protein D6705_03040 [Deltaproteobacteria bacterium]